MKIYDLRKKDGTHIIPKIHERDIWSSGDESLLDTLNIISKKMNIITQTLPDVFHP